MNEYENAVSNEDWADFDMSDIEDETAETETSEADQQIEGQAEAEQTDEVSDEEKSDGADQTFTLKYLGAEKSVNRDEVITLAQKGMDYDRIRSRYNEVEKSLNEANEKLKGYSADATWLEAMKGVAEEQGTDLGEIVMNIIASQKAAKNGTTVAAELPKVKLDFERKSFEKQKLDWENNKGEKAAAVDADAEIQAEIEEFQSAFPEAAENAKAIPKEVWDAKNADPKKSLAQHYRDYLYKQKDAEIASLKAQLEQKAQSEKNKERSTGSVHSGSSGTKNIDPFDLGWGD